MPWGRDRGRGRMIWPRGHMGLEALTSLVYTPYTIIYTQRVSFTVYTGDLTIYYRYWIKAMLPQTDRATRQLNAVTTSGTSCATNTQRIEVTEIEHYGRQTCSKPRARWVYNIDRRNCGQQVRPSISFVDNTIDLPWRNFLSPEFGTNFRNFLISQRVRGRTKPPCQKKPSSNWPAISYFDRTPTCDRHRQTDTGP